MQKLFFHKIAGWCMTIFTIVILFSSCEKDKDGSPDIKAGNMASGALNPGEAGGGELLTLEGAGIGDIRSIVFEKNNVPAAFQPTLNTETHLIFHVPDTAYGGPQNVIFTNSAGKTLSVPFTVLAFASVSEASNYNFTEGVEITLTGNNLDDVSKVVFTGSTEAITVLSKERKKMVIKMPATQIARATLDITNSTGVTTTTQEFINLDKALKIFTDAYGPITHGVMVLLSPPPNSNPVQNPFQKLTRKATGMYSGLLIGGPVQLTITTNISPSGSKAPPLIIHYISPVIRKLVVVLVILIRHLL
jgi:IPT/TIG domain